MSASFRRYGKIKAEAEAEAQAQVQIESKKKTRRRGLVIVVSCIILVVAAACLVVGVTRIHKHSSDSDTATDNGLSAGSKAIEAACNTTVYKQTCIRDLSAYPGSFSANPRQLVSFGLKIALDHVQQVWSFAGKNSTQQGLGDMEKKILKDCLELLGDSADHLNESISMISNTDLRSFLKLNQTLEDARVYTSASLTGQTICVDQFEQLAKKVPMNLQDKLEDVKQVITNALGLVTTFSKLGKDISSWKIPRIPHLRRLLSDADTLEEGIGVSGKHSLSSASSVGEFPKWLSAADRKLLQAPTSSVQANAFVAQDSSGSYKTIQDAVNAAPTNGARFTIYIKSGIYSESVLIKKTTPNIMFIGDGIGKTVITGSKNFAIDGITTYQTATVAIMAKGFIAKGITFRNTAGPQGHQAVALRSANDFIVFDTCSFEGYQDTLYPISFRQFFRGCTISGTIDYIFGNAAAVFQNCVIVSRQPLSTQQNTVTAQGRTVADAPTGFSFQNCKLIGESGLSSSTQTYLGRPWKAYSRTVFIQSFMDQLINPKGWLPWDPTNPFTDTLYYGEYANTGPGSNIANRVTWKGVHSAMTLDEAVPFSVNNLISGTSWLPATNVAFDQSIS